MDAFLLIWLKEEIERWRCGDVEQTALPQVGVEPLYQGCETTYSITAATIRYILQGAETLYLSTRILVCPECIVQHGDQCCAR